MNVILSIKGVEVEVFDLGAVVEWGRSAVSESRCLGRIVLFSDEYENRHRQCVGFVESKAGVFDRRIWARKCAVSIVPMTEAEEFIGLNHIQGASKLSLVVFGLYHDGDLLGVASLGRHNRQIAENRVVLERLCFVRGVQVVGGASRLFAACCEWAREHGYDEIITFSDSRITDGGVYSKMGFALERTYKPDYFYVRDGLRISKQSQKKGNVGCPVGKSEFEWATERGLVRGYDAGKRRWVFNLWPEAHETWGMKASEKCAKQHSSGDFRHAHIRGYFESKKAGKVYYGSSFELRCMFELDGDSSVESFRRCDAFRAKDKWRNPDLWVTFSDGHSEIWEVKPVAMLERDEVKCQIADFREYAGHIGTTFRVWTEADSSLGGEHEIVKWARSYLAEHGDTSRADAAKLKKRERAARYYAKNVATDLVTTWCSFCGCEHVVQRKRYDKNVAKNGQYICERHGGHISGKRERKRRENPYALDGRKQCSRCGQILSIDCFDKRTASFDSLSASCKSCAYAARMAKRR